LYASEYGGIFRIQVVSVARPGSGNEAFGHK